MKRYILSAAAAFTHVPDHPERTAKRFVNWDVMYQVWPNRAAMLKTIEIQERGDNWQNAWKACK